MHRSALRGEIEMLKESLRMKEEALETLICREAKSKHEKSVLARGSEQESLAVVTGCKDGSLLCGKSPFEGLKIPSSTEPKLAQPKHSKDVPDNFSPPFEHEMHINDKAAVRVILQEMERLCREHVTLVTISLD